MKIRKYLKYVGLAMDVSMDIVQKTADGVFTVPEMIDSIENAARKAVPGIDDGDFERFEAITTPSEFKNFDFQNGDVALIIPKEMTDKLRLDFDVQ